MGITGLLPIIKKILQKKHIGKYSFSKIGIDGHAWIHQVLPSISYELYTGKPVKRHLSIFMSKIQVLLDNKITPIFVFDGDRLESKEKTTNERTLLRNKAKAEVEFYLKRNDLSKARELMKRCVSVTEPILSSILMLLKANGIEYIVAPYEADAQLYFLQKISYIDHIITEDSDLMVYGASSILYKFTGTHVEEYNVKDLDKAKDSYFKDNLLDICILSGCDYIDSIKGVGLVTAYKVLKEKTDVKSFVDHMISNNKEVPTAYLEQFNKAKTTFMHHIVYNPLTKTRQFLTEPIYDCSFLGSLEDIPIKTETPFDTHVLSNRHYIPMKNRSIDIYSPESSFINNPDEKYIIDSQVSLPFFNKK